VTNIGSNAFYNCTALVTANLPEALVTIDASAFEGCISLRTVIIPGSVKFIGQRAFAGCTSLTVTIPFSVTTIGGYAFEGCHLAQTCRKRYLQSQAAHFLKGFADETREKGQRLPPLSERRFGTIVHGISNRPICCDDFKVQPLHEACAAPHPTVEHLDRVVTNGFQSGEEEFLANKTVDDFARACREPEPFTGLTPLHLACANDSWRHPRPTGMCSVRLTNVFTLKSLKVVLVGVERNEKEHLKVVEYLTKWDHTSVAAKDWEDKVPLRRALDSRQPVSTLLYLFALHPIYDIRFEHEDGDRYWRTDTMDIKMVPLRYLLRLHRNPPNSISSFSSGEQNGFVEFISSPDILKMTPNFDGFFFIENKYGEKNFAAQLYAENLTDVCINLINHCTREVVEVLSYCKDFNGRVAIDRAVSKIKTALQNRSLFLGRFKLNAGKPMHKSETCVVIKAQDFQAEAGDRAEFQRQLKNYKKGDGQTFIEMSDFQKVVKNLGLQYDETLLTAKFKKWSVVTSNGISEDEYVQFVKEELDHGGLRFVVLKLMKNEDQFKRELESRGQYGLDPQYVVSVLRTYGVNSAKEGTPQTAVEHLQFTEDLQMENLSEYKHALVMPCAERNGDTIFRSERPESLEIRLFAKQTAEAVQHVHNQGIIHGDLKLLNIVRQGHRIRLIDLDACTEITKSNAEHFTGAKFSSGILPPEVCIPLSPPRFLCPLGPPTCYTFLP
jgi:hypothetical protein